MRVLETKSNLYSCVLNYTHSHNVHHILFLCRYEYKKCDRIIICIVHNTVYIILLLLLLCTTFDVIRA